jgi:hypothetical protein
VSYTALKELVAIENYKKKKNKQKMTIQQHTPSECGSEDDFE